jgi:Tol biopolymer transport system component
MKRFGFLVLMILSTGSLRGAGGASPRLLAPGVISTAPLAEMGGTFSPDGAELYFTVRTPTTTTPPLSVICFSRLVNGRWTRPEVAPFSGRDFDSAPAFSPDGSRLFFSSYRPASRGAASRGDSDIWEVARDGDHWGSPRNLGEPVNTTSNDTTPSVAADGTLYFASDRPGGKGSFDLYRARPEGGGYAKPENLGDAVNTEAAELTPFVTPDQHLLLFSAVGRADMALAGGEPYARADIYAADWKEPGWSTARRLPEPVNGVAADSYPFLSPDGRTLYFTSERQPTVVPAQGLTFRRLEKEWREIENGQANIYVIGAEIVHVPEGNRGGPPAH